MKKKEVEIIVEDLRQKLGIKESMEKLLEGYRSAKLTTDPSGREDDTLPETARMQFYPWVDVLCSMLEDPQHVYETEEKCPVCGHKHLSICFSSPMWTWVMLCGRGGTMIICPHCPEQVDFSLEVMN